VSRPYAEVEREAAAVLARHARSFRWASWFLPGNVRRDAAIVYAFCRMVDDAADDGTDVQSARECLATIRAMLEGEQPQSSLVAAYHEVAARTGFGLAPARALLAGAASDLEKVRVADDAELLTYCYRVAGTVGLMMCGVLGVTEPDAKTHAVALGMAMQLTNICRDVREDALLDRVYLPRARLLASGLDASSLHPEGILLAASPERAAVSRAVLHLLCDSERLYARATEGFRYIPARTRLGVWVAASLYRGIGRRLQRTGGDALAGRTVVPVGHKLLLATISLGAWLRSLALPSRPRPLLGPGPSLFHLTSPPSTRVG